MAFITNFSGAAADQQLFAVDLRSAQSATLGGNLFGTLGGAQLSSLDAVFGGVQPLPFSTGFNPPQAFDFSQQMLQVLSQLSGGWAGFAGAPGGFPGGAGFSQPFGQPQTFGQLPIFGQPPNPGGGHCH